MRFVSTCIQCRYVKSRSDDQLLHGLGYNKTSSCEPQALENGLPTVPCGLVAWSLFNDTYSFSRGTKKLKIERTNIAWKSDRDHKFGKKVYPFNFQNGSFIGGGKLDTTIPVSSLIKFSITYFQRKSMMGRFGDPLSRMDQIKKLMGLTDRKSSKSISVAYNLLVNSI